MRVDGRPIWVKREGASSPAYGGNKVRTLEAWLGDVPPGGGARPVLRSIGFGVPVLPQGAFYVYADCSAFGPDSYAFAHSLLEETGVAVTPGNDFGTYRAERHVRFSYATSLDDIEEAPSRALTDAEYQRFLRGE